MPRPESSWDSQVFVAAAQGSGTGWVDAARLAGAVSATFALLAFFPRDYPLVDLADLRRGYLAAESRITRLALLDTHLTMLAQTLLLNDHKSRRLQASIVALPVAIILLFVGLVAGPDRGGRL